jgi:hypothetical protein
LNNTHIIYAAQFRVAGQQIHSIQQSPQTTNVGRQQFDCSRKPNCPHYEDVVGINRI